MVEVPHTYLLLMFTAYIPDCLFLYHPLLPAGGKTPDPGKRTFADVMHERDLKREEVGCVWVGVFSHVIEGLY